MKCETIQADLKAYCDSELPLLRRLAVRRHVAQCDACREEIAAMEKITQTLQSTERAEPLPESLRSRILIDAARQVKPAASSPAPPLLGAGGAKRRLSPAVVGAVCVIIALAAFVTLPVFHESREKARQVSPRYSGMQDDAYVMNKNEAFPARIASGGTLVVGQPPAGGTAQSLASLARGGKAGYAGGAPSAAGPMASPASDLSSDFSLDRQVHREASLTVQLKDPEAASDQVAEMVKDAGGYVAQNDLTTDDSGEKSAQMSLKAPVVLFDTVLGQIEKLGNVTAKNVTGEDITGKVSDSAQAESVLEDEVAQSNSHLAAMGRHARWEDEEDARQLRIELAQARARVQLLHKLAALADISVDLTQTPKPVPPAQTGFLSNLHNSGSAAFQSMLATLSTVLTALIWILAYIPIWGPLAFAAWYTRRYLRETRA